MQIMLVVSLFKMIYRAVAPIIARYFASIPQRILYPYLF